MKNRGIFLVLLLLGAGLAAAAGAIWHQYRQTRQSLRFWGAEAASLIGNAPTVQLTAGFSPENDGAQKSASTSDDQRAIDISGAPGLVHFRRSLLEDQNFDWNAEPPASAGDWDYRVQFVDDGESVTIVFDLDRQLVAIEGREGGQASLSAKMAKGVGDFLSETRANASE